MTPVASIHRMVIGDHICPWGLKALHLLRQAGYRVEDHPLASRAETDAFKAEHGVKTTPQIFIDGRRIGGHDDLRRFLGKTVRDPNATTYRPVATLFVLAALMALAIGRVAEGTVMAGITVERFVAISMVLLALQKLRDVDGFATGFLGYDLLARRWLPYAYIYPYAEAGAGLLMLAGVAMWMSAPVMILIGGIGAASVFKAVYIDRRDLKCACVGGNSNVPLGFVSLTENLMMLCAGLWMIVS
ncbi:MauE/DoxX family redox-associated membrane protein [Sphingomonas sp.]